MASSNTESPPLRGRYDDPTRRQTISRRYMGRYIAATDHGNRRDRRSQSMALSMRLMVPSPANVTEPLPMSLDTLARSSRAPGLSGSRLGSMLR
jgi:hypothetical protein